MVNEQFPHLKNHVLITPKMQNHELLEKLAADNVMLLFNYYSYMGTKIFDYLGIRRKMIMCYENDAEANLLKQKFYSVDESGSESKQLQADLIHETNSGIIVKDSHHLQEVLQELYIEFEQPTLVKSIRLVCEYAEAFEVFKIDAWEEEGGMSSLDYFLYLLNNAHNKYNKDELKSLNTYIKARLDGEEVEYVRPDEEEEN
jgi:hypothetical protein